jgi:hypothetical protein
MPSPRTNRRLTIARMACAALVALAAGEPRAEVLPLTSADGGVIETNKFSQSTRFAGAIAVWVPYSYAISVDCSPPRACYASTQVINYHFSCWPRYNVVVESISMDLNGDVVKHAVYDPTPVPNYEASDEVLNRFCGPPPEPLEVPRRTPPPERGKNPRPVR